MWAQTTRESQGYLVAEAQAPGEQQGKDQIKDQKGSAPFNFRSFPRYLDLQALFLPSFFSFFIFFFSLFLSFLLSLAPFPLLLFCWGGVASPGLLRNVAGDVAL